MPQTDLTTSFAVAFAGMAADASDSTDNYISRASGETVKQIAFGMAVMQGVNDDQCLQLTSQTPVLLGIAAYSAAYAINKELATIADSDGNLGLLPQTVIQIKKRGAIWVTIDENVDPTAAVRVRTSVVSTVGPGTFRKSALATHTIDLSKFAKWSGTYLATGKIGKLEFDFTMAAGLVADS